MDITVHCWNKEILLSSCKLDGEASGEVGVRRVRRKYSFDIDCMRRVDGSGGDATRGEEGWSAVESNPWRC